jgi:periplasmic divalent cation tolerance protein
VTPFPVEPAEAAGPMRVVLTTFPSEEVADRIVRELVERRFAACAQRFPIRSTYWWHGEVERSEEVLVLFKTLPKQVGALFRRLRAVHPYEVPEIVELSASRVDQPYLDYLYETVGGGRAPYPLGVDVGRVRRSGSPRGRGARSPRGTRARPRRPSR